MMRVSRIIRLLSVSVIVFAASACSSGGSETANTGSGGSGVNLAPSANAGGDLNVSELTTVNLTGSGSDPNAGDSLGYLWTQLSGTAVTINDDTSAQASFSAPDVPANAPETLVFRLTVTDQGGLSASDDVSITVAEPAAMVTISGKLEYEAPVHNPQCDGLNFQALEINPIRGATVQLVANSTQSVVQSTTSDEQGNYVFSNVDGSQSVFVRVRAELKRTGPPSWDVEVRDNTAQTTQPLNLRPLYVLDGMATNPNGQDAIRDMRAVTGWNSSTGSFDGTRSAAPFAILDTIYQAMQFVAGADPLLQFDALDVYWSINNTSAGSGDIDNGDIGTSFYVSNGLYLLGKQGDDIEEFDYMVIAHEWGHYFEDNFSRSDSIGGAHGSFDRLDMRVAFGEGFATALAGMAMNDGVYCDTFWAGGLLRGFDIRLEDENTDPTGSSPDTEGWYNESSVMKILFDLWDTAADGADTGSVGFPPLYTVMVGPQASTQAFTSIFSFAEALKNSVDSSGQGLVDELLRAENVEPTGIDEWGTLESNDAGSPITLPVYTTIPANGTPVKVCSSGGFDSIGPNATGNKLNTHRFLRVDIPSQQNYTFSIQADAATLAALPPDDPTDDRDQSDPDMFYYQTGAVRNQCTDPQCNGVEGTSGEANQEVFTTQTPLPVATYVIDFHDWRYEDSGTSAGYPVQTCFDVSVSPAP